jgi:hypothetical protein
LFFTFGVLKVFFQLLQLVFMGGLFGQKQGFFGNTTRFSSQTVGNNICLFKIGVKALASVVDPGIFSR